MFNVVKDLDIGHDVFRNDGDGLAPKRGRLVADDFHVEWLNSEESAPE